MATPHDNEELGAFFRGLGPKAEEAYVTAAEKLTAQVRAKALAEGRAEGQAAVLLKLLGLRFGPLSEQQQSMVQAATPEPLDRWAEKVLSAAKLEDVLES